ncbi:hypothetical protein A9W99_14840 [Mycobacterium sp. 1164966.3]|nr:hypothetical protein A9W99_14840 [Mycobacterium sp. 1164966.3]
MSWLAVVAILAAVVTGCSGDHSSTALPGSSSGAAGRTSAVSLPDAPPPDAGCQGDVTAHRDIGHPSLGTVRLLLMLTATKQVSDHGCVVAVADTGKAIIAIPLDIEGNSLAFADPVTDSTGNAFVTYNPGRYDGVLVLVPTPSGFQDPGWSTPGIHYVGKRAYYDAKPQGPGPDGKYTIVQSRNDCEPDCAGGTITNKVLHWDGKDYVA